MQMKTGVEQSVYAVLILNMLPEKAVLPGDVISQQLGASPTYFHKLLRKLVNANLIASVPGSKGGFKLKKKAKSIEIYDIYLAIEGQQTLYSSSGVFHDLLDLEGEDKCCMLSELMEEAESSWKSVLRRETITSLYEEIKKDFPAKVEKLQQMIDEKMVL